MRFQERDGAILSAIYRYDGLLGRRHIRKLFFPDATLRATQKRLSVLVEAGYLDRPDRKQRQTQPISEPVYWLGWRGILWVAAESNIHVSPPINLGENQLRQLAKELRAGGIRWLREPRWLQIAHDMAVVDLRLAVERAVKDTPYLFLEEWKHESEFRADGDTIRYSPTGTDGRTKQAEKRVYPDSYFVILDQQRLKEGLLARARLLLELDNATHSNIRFGREKVEPGIAYVKSPEYRARFGDNSGRWLVVTTGTVRMRHLMRQAKQVAGAEASIFYFATFDQTLASNILLDPIWRQPGKSEPTSLFAKK